MTVLPIARFPNAKSAIDSPAHDNVVIGLTDTSTLEPLDSPNRAVWHVMTRSWVVLAGVFLFPTVGLSQAQTQRGATLGAITGAIAGGLIGDHNNEAGAGAAIGGAIGAVAGGLLGNANDKEAAAAQQRYYYEQQQRQAVVVQQQAVYNQSAVSVADVVSMSRSGLSDSLIVNQIQQRGVREQLQVHDIISLHQQGVRETVISAMQQARIGSQPTVVASPPVQVVAPQTVIVEEHYVLPRYAPHHYHYYRRSPVHSHHHWGF